MTVSKALAGKVALVFGGSRGIGAATAYRLAQEGADVAFTSTGKGTTATETVRLIESADAAALAITADSGDPQAVRHAVDSTVQRFGGIDIAVVCAGIFRPGEILDVSLDDLDAMLAVNVRGAFLSIQASAAHMKAGGRIITIGSVMGDRAGMPGISLYSLTKAALGGMVRAIALDLAPRGITVNNVQAGTTLTDMTAPYVEMVTPRIPVGRVAMPEEIAGLVAYLARDEAGYVTGASIGIDGGVRA